MNLLHRLQEFLQYPNARRASPELHLISKRPDPPVASILRDLDEIFGLSLAAVGNIISSGTTIPREEIIEGMLEWAKGSNSEFAKSKYFPRLEALRSIAQGMSGHPAFGENLEQALTRPLPAAIDSNRRTIASYIQADAFTSLDIIRGKLQI